MQEKSRFYEKIGLGDNVERDIQKLLLSFRKDYFDDISSAMLDERIDLITTTIELNQDFLLESLLEKQPTSLGNYSEALFIFDWLYDDIFASLLARNSLTNRFVEACNSHFMSEGLKERIKLCLITASIFELS